VIVARDREKLADAAAQLRTEYGVSVEAHARAGYRAMMRGRRAAIPGLVTKLLALAGELPPRAIALHVNRWLLRS
jgi:short-subunit dehydrogenase